MSSSTFATMRCCSASGGRGIDRDLMLFTLSPGYLRHRHIPKVRLAPCVCDQAQKQPPGKVRVTGLNKAGALTDISFLKLASSNAGVIILAPVMTMSKPFL
jgi:hypothetical protein